jgi:hypothetical protein
MSTLIEQDIDPPKIVRQRQRNPGARNCQLATGKFSLPATECERRQFGAPETLAQESDLRWLQLNALTLDRDDDAAQIARADLSREFSSSH